MSALGNRTDRDRERLAAALAKQFHAPFPMPWMEVTIDALLPVVNRIASEHAAAELEAAAEGWPRASAAWLLERAAALRGAK